MVVKYPFFYNYYAFIEDCLYAGHNSDCKFPGTGKPGKIYDSYFLSDFSGFNYYSERAHNPKNPILIRKFESCEVSGDCLVEYINYYYISSYNTYLLTLIHTEMQFPWFKRIGIFFIPVSIVGWIILMAGFVIAILSFMDIDGRSHSVSDTMINFVFILLIIGAIYSLAAYLTSRVAKK